MKFKCQTLFDITATGVTGHFKSSRIPFQDQAGNQIIDESSWNRARNQQRNYETILQLISLRTQIFNVTKSTVKKKEWTFEFEVETPYAYGNEEDPVANLKLDSDSVPMLVGLNNRNDVEQMLITQGPKQNIWFELIAINNILENSDG